MLSARVGAEDRRRSGESSTTAPYVEATCRYDYAVQSFVSAGYTYSLVETDNPTLFTDSKMNQFFVNVQACAERRDRRVGFRHGGSCATAGAAGGGR